MLSDKSNIVLRSSKGAPLTHIEMDTNLNEIRNVIDDIADVLDDSTGIVQLALNARDAAEGFAVDTLGTKSEIQALTLQSQQAAIDAGNAADLKVQILREDMLSEEGAYLSGWFRKPPALEIKDAGTMLDAQAVHIREYSHLVTSKLDPVDPMTWDWSPALLAACAAGRIVRGGGLSYRISPTTISSRVDLRQVTLMPLAAMTEQVLLTVLGNDSFIDIDINADGKGITCLDVGGNRVKGQVSVSNVVGRSQSTGGTQSGIRIFGQDCSIDIWAQDMDRGTSDNDSIPRIATLDTVFGGLGNNNTIRIFAKNVNGGLVCSQPLTYAPVIMIDGIRDNGIYQLQGAIDVGTMTVKNGIDEPIVSEGKCHVGTLRIIDCTGGTSLQEGDLTIDEYIISSSDPQYQFVPMRTRADNVSSKVRIGTLRGEIYLVPTSNGAGIFQFLAGEVTDFDVDVIDLKVNYLTTSTKLLARNDNGKRFRIGSMRIELVDTTGTLSTVDKFDFRLAPAVTKPSYLGHVSSYSLTGDIRVAEVIQPKVTFAPYQEISTTFGPYLLAENLAVNRPRVFYGTAVPNTGNWLKGDVMAFKTPALGGVTEYTCVDVTVQPGTWRASKWTVGRGLTRPTLLANDAGVQFLDNNLVSTGKLITWNGTAWVDTTGAVV